MERLTIEHINGLIDSEEYIVTEQYVQCILMIGEAPVIGTSYRFSKATHDPERAKTAARDEAIRSLFSLEAYHQKRLRGGMGNFWVEEINDNGKGINLKLGNPFEGMAERDVSLTFAGVDCQAALKEYADSPQLTGVEKTQALAADIKRFESQGAAEESIQLQNRQTPAKEFMTTPKDSDLLFDQRNKTL